MSNSLLGVVLPLRMEAASYSVALTGTIMAAYYLGLAFGGLHAKRLILKIGHIRAFAVFAALTTVTTLAYSQAFTPTVWFILRIINGFCIAGLTTAIESWLNERSNNATRGRVLGLYMLTFYLAVATGQTLVNLANVDGPELFILSACLIGLSLIPVALTSLGEPNLKQHRPLRTKELYAASPVGFFGAGVAGLLVGSFYALGIVFARRIGLSVSEAALFMSVVVLGGLAFQLPIGILADRYDRRVILAGALMAVGVCWGLLARSISTGSSFYALLILAIGFGGAMSSVYPICVAQTFDRLERKHYVAAAGRLLMVYSIGATVGPLLASALMAVYGPYSFFAFESAVAMIFAIFLLLRVRRQSPLPAEQQEIFVPIPDVTPVAIALDPRTDPD
ncbi:MFS transporter [Aurantimonas sp. C2-6-R+9]|uniref:MFS transporter n=1 Tax=unclassified Aurantimonas TaxID=2638230 RepID=UPI002E16EB76|nr:MULTISPECIES: MFS transporter [unclassified Aurantimonas]MEC5293780.1 MFS transporter [Aurantimonas sp. C2-3-R2]MEC5383958.1 MFS transporter [Aurantimonas sp. C2-6-R+9]MEC5414839.1 MFS transporter [Aurantimonas sp. C2-4-R8]